MTDAVKALVDMDAERVKFEAAYLVVFNKATDSNKGPAYMVGLREGANYGDRPYLNGMWDGWKLRLAAGGQTFTLAQLREAVILWESDVRANPDAFKSADETRAEPIDQCADAYMAVIGSYLDKVTQ